MAEPSGTIDTRGGWAGKSSSVTASMSSLHLTETSLPLTWLWSIKMPQCMFGISAMPPLFAGDTLTFCSKNYYFFLIQQLANCNFLKSIFGGCIQCYIHSLLLCHHEPELTSLVQMLNRVKMAEEYVTGVITTYYLHMISFALCWNNVLPKCSFLCVAKQSVVGCIYCFLQGKSWQDPPSIGNLGKSNWTKSWFRILTYGVRSLLSTCTFGGWDSFFTILG